ncbi:hypothetical protein [Proteus columbae]|uniref:hypothetical protein n=1 Tax=Proteus columbae TaxID=1987580 RepID=UPI0028897776|nr:hypothetical protein [Proteus columbae]
MSEQNLATVSKNGCSKVCSAKSCNEFIFINSNDKLTCKRCGTPRLLSHGEVIDAFPRKNSEFFDRVNQLSRYSFHKGADSVKRVPDAGGNYIDYHEVVELMSLADERIRELSK